MGMSILRPIGSPSIITILHYASRREIRITDPIHAAAAHHSTRVGSRSKPSPVRSKIQAGVRWGRVSWTSTLHSDSPSTCVIAFAAARDLIGNKRWAYEAGIRRARTGAHFSEYKSDGESSSGLAPSPSSENRKCLATACGGVHLCVISTSLVGGACESV